MSPGPSCMPLLHVLPRQLWASQSVLLSVIFPFVVFYVLLISGSNFSSLIQEIEFFGNQKMMKTLHSMQSKFVTEAALEICSLLMFLSPCLFFHSAEDCLLPIYYTPFLSLCLLENPGVLPGTADSGTG